MKIALINPRVANITHDAALAQLWESNPASSPYVHIWTGVSPALMVVAALCPSDSEVTFYDDGYDEIDYSQSFDVVGISLMTCQADRAYEIADEFRTRGTTVIVGGLHPTVMPGEAKAHADAVVIGEAERLWPAALADLSVGRLKPFYQAQTPADLTESPIPRYDLLKRDRYGFVHIQTSRGCPHDCEFCAASKVYGRRYRRKSNRQVLDEIALTQRFFGGTPVFFSDDNFLVDKRSSKEMLRQLIPYGVRWAASADVSIAEDDELLDLMRESGCASVLLGLESLSEENMRRIDSVGWKGDKLRRYPEYIEHIQSRGVSVTGSFIVGLDSDDTKVFDTIGRFIEQTGLYRGLFTILTPMPGTRLRERMAAEDRLLSSKWSELTGYNVTYRPRRMTEEELQSGLLGLYQQTFSEQAFGARRAAFTQLQVARRMGKAALT